MNTRLLWLTVLVFSSLGLKAQVQYTTERPRVDDANDQDVSIRRIELTDRYTIIYMTFQSRKRRTTIPDIFPFPPNKQGQGQQQVPGNTINFEPTARLYADQGAKSFKFIRAENIPTEKRRDVTPGERVDFAAYFERLAPGIEVFDLFECSDRNRPNSICFNFWGVHVINPKKPQTQQKPKPTQPAPATPPVQAPAPEPTPPVQVTPTTPTILALKGVVRDAKTKKSVVATLTYRLISGAETTGEDLADSVRSDRSSGSYTINAAPLSVYAVSVSAKGYFSQSDTVTITRGDKIRDFNLMPIETGTKITLNNIYFNVSKYDLKPESFPELDRLAQLMKENPTMAIRLEGHTDIVGDFDANVELSRNRVNEVKRYLATKGISTSRVETVGYGPSRPLNTNKSVKERPENRRVEMVVIKA